MGYYSYVSFVTTKSDFKKIKNVQDKILDNHLFDESEIEEYKENDIDCTHVELGYIKYYKEFEEIQALEKSLSKAKDGYVFCRLGEEPGDIEFRNRTKLPELMSKYEFIKELKDNLNKEFEEEEEEEFE